MKYTEFDRDKVLDYYREAAPDYDVQKIIVNSIDGSSLKQEWSIVFKRGIKTLTLEQAIVELELLTPEQILN